MAKVTRKSIPVRISKLRNVGYPKEELVHLEQLVDKFLRSRPYDHKATVHACKTIRHLGSAQRYRDSHPDSTVQREARTLLRAIGFAKSLDELGERPRKFAGLLKKVGHNRKNKALREKAEWREVGDDGRLEEVNSKARLITIGRQLALCVAGMAYAGSYIRDVEDRDAELWAYYRGDTLYALIKVRTDDRSIAECRACKNRTPTFKGREARAILAALNATGDDEEAFTRVGVYSVFGGEKPLKTTAFALDNGRALKLWRYPTEIIAATRKTEGKRWHWSRFYRKGIGWDDDWNNSLTWGELLQLILTRPGILNALGIPD